MKKLIVVLAIGALAAPAMAQFGGLPYADSAAAPEAGLMRVSGGLVMGDDFNTYGGRFTYGVMDGLAVFGDLGLLDPDEGDSGFAYQGGAKFTLPLELPVDLAVRAAIGMASYDVEGGDADMTDFNGGVLASKDLDMFTPYAFIGLNYLKWEVSADTEFGSFDADDDETDIALAGGVIFSLTDQISLYGEVAYIDDPFFAAGGRFQF